MDKTAQDIVDFALRLDFKDIPSPSLHAAKARVVDSMGCAMAAFLAPPVRALRRVATPISDGHGARLFGTLMRTTPEMAAVVNGTMVRYLDMSDAYLMTSTAHPSDNIPGLMAVAEARGRSGKDLLLAIAISYEVQCRFCDLVPFHDHGWDQPVSGAPAAAAGAGRLLGLDREQMLHAVSLAVVPNNAFMQTRTGELSMWKGVAGPNAARAGVFAALLAEQGMTGPDMPFEGKFGVWKLTADKAYKLDLPRKFKGHVFAVKRTNIKMFPVRDAIQVPIMAALDLRKKIAAADIETLVIETYAKHFEGPGKDPALWAPQTRETADHSLPFSVAAALIDGEVSPASFERKRFLDADVTALMKRMRIELVDAYDKVAPATRTCRLVATTKAGKTVAAEVRQTPKDIERGPSDAAFEAKYHELASATLPESTRRAMLETIWRLDKLDTIDPLIELTAI